MWDSPLLTNKKNSQTRNERKLCLLIGNSRWHWAQRNKTKWEFFHTQPDAQKLRNVDQKYFTWAAVGAIPKISELTRENQLKSQDIPLINSPSWLGVDRALAGWGAFKKFKILGNSKNGLLIVDAGTILSLTRITTNGEFAGGQLVPGLHLQLSAMSDRAENLNFPTIKKFPTSSFPFATDEAMLKGSLQSLLGVILEAQKEANCPIWICGGDGNIIFQKLQGEAIDISLHPNLVLEGMINI